MAGKNLSIVFSLLREITIANQLATAELNRVLPKGLHVSHFSIVSHLFRQGDGRTPLQLAKTFQVTKQTITHSLSRLSDKGLIEVQSHPSDGRRRLVFLTKEGRAFYKKATELATPLLEDIDQAIGEDAIATALPILQQLREHLDQRRNE